MKARAWLAVTLVLTLAGFALLVASRPYPIPDTWGFRGFIALFSLLFGALGYLMATRRPENRIGWAFLIVGVLWGAAGAFLDLRARNELESVDMKPWQTIDTLKEDVQWAKSPKR